MVAENKNAICSICGRSYHRCLSCRDSMKFQPWKMFTDTAEHYKVFQAIRGLSTGVYDNEEFKSKLKNIDLSDLESYEESVKVLIKDALKENEPIIEEVVADEKPSGKATVARKRNYKVNNEVVEAE